MSMQHSTIYLRHQKRLARSSARKKELVKSPTQVAHIIPALDNLEKTFEQGEFDSFSSFSEDLAVPDFFTDSDLLNDRQATDLSNNQQDQTSLPQNYGSPLMTTGMEYSLAGATAQQHKALFWTTLFSAALLGRGAAMLGHSPPVVPSSNMVMEHMMLSRSPSLFAAIKSMRYSKAFAGAPVLACALLTTSRYLIRGKKWQ
eukprot:CAMPEP_0178904486 /NCGR_PEP_ID=MMETSP0786-20121207/5726_1 /TAXON_ID=186022 /ORGANISM="Thalassionema frauenfeldii, Strain CCMP 1798" /LENGTH=200 /DNA_ID=CAMNT_0020575947 /DNA_START=129 /DNA_END=731 /DNA_ORIENTATION=+